MESEREVAEAEADATKRARRVADEVNDFVFGKNDKTDDKADKGDKGSSSTVSGGRLSTTRR
eukprot:5115177-Heterocapsa_arctica.AAC.1